MGKKKTITKKIDETIRNLPVPSPSEYNTYSQRAAPEDIYKLYLQENYPNVPFYYDYHNWCYTVCIGKEYYIIRIPNDDYRSNDEETSEDYRFQQELDWFQEIKDAQIAKDGFDLINNIRSTSSFDINYLKWIDEQQDTNFFSQLTPTRLSALLKVYYAETIVELSEKQRQAILNATERPYWKWL